MFELDEKKRIDITAIRQHPWYHMPMRPEYDQALSALQAEQEVREQKVRWAGVGVLGEVVGVNGGFRARVGAQTGQMH